MLPTTQADNREVYKVGPFTYDADGISVIVTKDVPNGIISIAIYHYRNHDEACEMAYRMAMKQAKA